MMQIFHKFVSFIRHVSWKCLNFLLNSFCMFLSIILQHIFQNKSQISHDKDLNITATREKDKDKAVITRVKQHMATFIT